MVHGILLIVLCVVFKYTGKCSSPLGCVFVDGQLMRGYIVNNRSR